MRGVLKSLTGDARLDADLLADESSGSLVAALRRFLRDPYAPDAIYTHLHNARVELKVDRRGASDLSVGVLGFVDLIHGITEAAEQPDSSGAACKTATELLKEDAVRNYFRRWYRISPELIDLEFVEELSVYKVGTTSFIVKCSTPENTSTGRERRALKCLLPRYAGNPSIRDDLHHYPTSHAQFSKSAPRVYAGTDSHAVMEFINGRTLAETLEESGWPPLSDARLAFVKDFMSSLLSVLGSLHSANRHHGDLSPSNIILRDDRRTDPVLIDFGFNFVLQERVGSTVAMQRAATYVAPELLSGPDLVRRGQKPQLANDLYSVGTLLIELLAGREEARGAISGGAPDKLWQDAPGLAKIVEDLRDLAPSKRLVLISEQSAPEPYTDIRLALSDEIDLVGKFRAFASGTDEFDWYDIRQFLQIGQDQIRQLKVVDSEPEIRKRSTRASDYADYPRLLGRARWSLRLWRASLVVFVFFTLADIGAANGQNLIHAYGSVVPIDLGAWWLNALRRSAALSVALMGTAYYLKIYSMLTTRNLAGAQASEAETRMRRVAYAVTLVELIPVAVYPHGWSICCAIGGFIAVANNQATFAVAVDGARTKTPGSPSRDVIDHDRFLGTYQHWAPLMFWYALSLAGLQILMWCHVAHDEWLFALFVLLMNTVKVYRINCVKDASYMRANLDRRFFMLRRGNFAPETQHAERVITAGAPLPAAGAP